MTQSKNTPKNPFLVIAFLVSLGLFYSPVYSQNATNNDPNDTNVATDTDTNSDSAEPIQYVLEDIKGTVQVLEVGAKDWVKADEGEVVETGDEVKVGEKSEATMALGNDTSVHLDAQTDMKVTQIAPNETGGFLSRLQVVAGNLLADVKKHLQDSQSTFEVESNGVICGVRGTAFEVSAQGDTAQVATHEGSVEVGNGHENHMVEAGHLSSFRKGRFQLQRRLGRTEMQRFQKWRAFRQRVFQKRMQRLQDIQNHRRMPWKRHHPLAKRNPQKQFKRRPHR